MRRPPTTVDVRLAHWREVVAARPCADCGAPEGQACAFGQPPHDRAGPARRPARADGTRLHLSRFDAWLRPAAR